LDSFSESQNRSGSGVFKPETRAGGAYLPFFVTAALGRLTRDLIEQKLAAGVAAALSAQQLSRRRRIEIVRREFNAPAIGTSGVRISDPHSHDRVSRHEEILRRVRRARRLRGGYAVRKW
jgi:hypothetical protein